MVHTAVLMIHVSTISLCCLRDLFTIGTFPYLGFTILFLIVTSQEDERQASENGVLRVLPQLDHDTELREAQLAWLPEDHEEV